MTNKYTERCTTSLFVRETQNHQEVQLYNYKSIRMSKVQKKQTPNSSFELMPKMRGNWDSCTLLVERKILPPLENSLEVSYTFKHASTI